MRLLTYNIHKGIGGRDRLYRLPRIIEVIENEDPDLLCLQEVDRGVPRSRLHDQPKLLSEQFFSAGCTFQLTAACEFITSEWLPGCELRDVDVGALKFDIGQLVVAFEELLDQEVLEHIQLEHCKDTTGWHCVD